jgi:hypothetical protein
MQGLAPINPGEKEKVGYVPRNRQQPGATAGLVTSGLTDAGMLSGGRRTGTAADQQLDAEAIDGLSKLKAGDAEIDEGLDQINYSMDTLTRIAADMNVEVRIE